MTRRDRLTSTSSWRTLYGVVRLVGIMDAAVKKMVDKLRELQAQITCLQRQAESLKTSLDLIGIRPTTPFVEPWDEKYAASLPFKKSTLVEACKRILTDHEGDYLNKGQVEYLAVIGGYEFSTADRRNSVDVTLRRLAKGGYCEVERMLGPEGNKYRWIMRFPRKEPEKSSKV